MICDALPHGIADRARKCLDRYLVGIADVHRAWQVGLDQPVQVLDEIVDVTERSCLRAVSVHGDRFVGKRLLNEGRDCSTRRLPASAEHARLGSDRLGIPALGIVNKYDPRRFRADGSGFEYGYASDGRNVPSFDSRCSYRSRREIRRG
jgi:hypothetical protein